MAATNPSHNRPDLWYFPSDYAMRPAIPLHYSTGNAKPSPVPLTDLFPVFASSPSVNVSTAVPIVQLCVVGNSASGVGVPFPPAAAATSLSLCLFDKCQDALAKVSSDGGAATYEALVSVVGGGERGAAGETVTKHFNSCERAFYVDSTIWHV
ncbi:hypothetical protein BCR44DRAFT_1124827 [Catenaria anguillulae PL171]|uniref:Uncharacterized protein n=1 Tax=Catenaria anguillulae PL171 TaxID=765915 RepID=A0A1Y2HKV9_9FUNG|nr:hypothetical protein BCR44DRAFT_1124827 [Catenaria anguillulae PL171]